MLDYKKVPVDYMVDGVVRYIEYGVAPGHFLSALFSNDLLESFKRADDNNAIAMKQWAAFVYWEMPTGAHGSPELVGAWIESGGLRGQEAKQQARISEEASDGR